MRGEWTTGYTAAELDAAQERFDLVFPPDLVALLRECRPVSGYDWRFDHNAIRDMLAWPLEGLAFDVEQNSLWWPEWGERPGSEGERLEVLQGVVVSAPRLIPLISHRYLPADPCEAGNPVFSVYQSDVVYYGTDLDDYFDREFSASPSQVTGPIRRIRFWSELAEGKGFNGP